MDVTNEDIQLTERMVRKVTFAIVLLIWALVALILWLPTQGIPENITYDHDCTDGAYVKEADCAR